MAIHVGERNPLRLIKQVRHIKHEKKSDDFHSITQLVLTEKARQFHQNNVIQLFPWDLNFTVIATHVVITYVRLLLSWTSHLVWDLCHDALFMSRGLVGPVRPHQCAKR
jgi:hypothetical protein